MLLSSWTLKSTLKLECDWYDETDERQDDTHVHL